MRKNRCITAKKEDKVPIMLDKVSILQNAISVTEVNLTIKACVDSPIFKGLLVFGEVSGYKIRHHDPAAVLHSLLSQSG